MIELNSAGGLLRVYRYNLTDTILSGSSYTLPDLSALMVAGAQVVPLNFLMFNNSDGDLELPILKLNTVSMNIGTTLVRDVCINYYCTGDTPPDFPAWNTGGDIALSWGSWSGTSGNIILWLYAYLIPLTQFT